jgi:hypothetical protein
MLIFNRENMILGLSLADADGVTATTDNEDDEKCSVDQSTLRANIGGRKKKWSIHDQQPFIHAS